MTASSRATTDARAATGDSCPVAVPTIGSSASDPAAAADVGAEARDGTSEPARGAHRVALTYCTQCRWLARAAWMAQELLTTFPVETEVALVPGTGGVFQVRIDDQLVWDRRTDGGFPEITTLKRLVRDVVAPGRTLGHTDGTRTTGGAP